VVIDKIINVAQAIWLVNKIFSSKIGAMEERV
jgi:hypothetical protein